MWRLLRSYSVIIFVLESTSLHCWLLGSVLWGDAIEIRMPMKASYRVDWGNDPNLGHASKFGRESHPFKGNRASYTARKIFVNPLRCHWMLMGKILKILRRGKSVQTFFIDSNLLQRKPTKRVPNLETPFVLGENTVRWRADPNSFSNGCFGLANLFQMIGHVHEIGGPWTTLPFTQTHIKTEKKCTMHGCTTCKHFVT